MGPEDMIDWAEALRTHPDLLPWIIFITICAVVIAQHKRILAYFDSRIEAHKARERSDAILAELIRNNTAALDNNTAALKSVEADRGETRRMLAFHESASKERIDAVKKELEHMQTVINRVDDKVAKNNQMMAILEDRTDKDIY